MHCGSCGTNLPPGAAVCPICGVPTPYNVSQVPGSGAPYVPPQSSNDPTYISSPYSSTPSPPVPPTNYGSQTYNPSQQNPYATPPTNPYAPPPVILTGLRYLRIYMAFLYNPTLGVSHHQSRQSDEAGLVSSLALWCSCSLCSAW